MGWKQRKRPYQKREYEVDAFGNTKTGAIRLPFHKTNRPVWVVRSWVFNDTRTVRDECYCLNQERAEKIAAALNFSEPASERVPDRTLSESELFARYRKRHSPALVAELEAENRRLRDALGDGEAKKNDAGD